MAYPSAPATVVLTVLAVLGLCNGQFNTLSDDLLWNLISNGKTLGSCTIRNGTTGTACDLYAIAGGIGWPTTPQGGTGCVKAPDYPKKVNTCYYSNPLYALTTAQVTPMCTAFGKANAVAQIRNALQNGKCCCISADYIATLSVDVIWALTTNGKQLGSCTIRNGAAGTACDLYVIAGGIGWPTTPQGGTGCVKAPDFPKRVNTCYYSDPLYALTTAQVAPMCTAFGKANAVAQILHALQNGKCGFKPCIAFS